MICHMISYRIEMLIIDKISSHDLQFAKHLRFQRRCTRFSEHVLLDFVDVVRSEIIIKSSLETRHIANI
jgi:hypothetical protein